MPLPGESAIEFSPRPPGFDPAEPALFASTGTDAKAVPPVHGKNCVPYETSNEMVLKVKRYILLALGYPNVEVELCDEHLEWSIQNAVDEFIRHNILDAMRYWRIPTQTNVSQYELPDDLLVVRDVTTLKIAEFDTIFGTDILINPLYLRNSKEAYQDVLTFWLSEAAFETWRRVYGLDITWDIIENKKFIRIYPTPRETRFMIIKGTFRMSVDDFDDRALGNKQELFRRLALAHAMQILGRIRGKRPAGIPSSQGMVQLDGDTLRQEAQTELEKIREEMIKSGKPLGFWTG